MPEAVYVDMPEIMTNLDAGPHRIAFREAAIQDRDGSNLVMPRRSGLATPRIVDMGGDLSEGRPARGAAQRQRVRISLREALLQRAAVAVPDASVANVLFEELLVQ